MAEERVLNAILAPRGNGSVRDERAIEVDPMQAKGLLGAIDKSDRRLPPAGL
jgi:hypothetical protein